MLNETNENENETVRTDSGHANVNPGLHTEVIDVSALSILTVPAEDVGCDDAGGEDVDFSADVAPVVRKPDQFERFLVDAGKTMTTRLLVVKSGKNGIETRYYSVAKALRGPVHSGMRDCLILPWFSLRDRCWALWVLRYHPGSSWFDSVAPLFRQPAEFYSGKSFTAEANKIQARYVIRWFESDANVKVRPLTRPVSQLLGSALGVKGFISDPSHPAYRQIVEGENVQ